MEHIQDIVFRYLQGNKLSPEESDCLNTWLLDDVNKQEFTSMQRVHVMVKCSRIQGTRSKEDVLKHIKNKHRSHRLIIVFGAIAAICCLLVGIYVLFIDHMAPMEDSPLYANQVTLTLSSGHHISLDELDADVADLVAQDAVVEWKQGDELNYKNSSPHVADAYHTLTIPVGCEYRLVLQDGTQVWLNANTEFRYPISFVGASREVYVKGEAYFDVVRDTTRPFLVHCGDVTTRVLGTSFNVRNYADRPQTTTLVSGSVETHYNNKVFLIKPGEQFVCDGQSCSVNQVNVDPIIAWRYGNFMVKECRLDELLGEVARWYDLKLFYQNAALKDLIYTATFSRSLEPEVLIDILGKTRKARFTLKDKTLIISQ
ncbi:MAG: FecR family protein [Marinifilaceae bacterium]